MRRLTLTSSTLVSVVFAAALFAGALGCSPVTAYSAPISAPSGSGYSSSIGSSIGSSSFGGESFSAPQRADPKGDLVVRPDAISIVFAVKYTDADAQKAIGSLEKYTADVLARFQQATTGAASMKMCGASVQPVSKGGKALSEGEAIEYAALLDGSIEIRLAPEQDYWARSRLLAAITGAARSLVEATKGKDGEEKQGPQVHFNEPQVVVKDVEVYRAKLTERWVKRARELALAAEAASAPLYLVDCAPPPAIEQRAISLEEIGLSLPLSCHVDAMRVPANPK